MRNNKKQSPFLQLKEFAKPYKLKFIASIILACLGVAVGLVPYLAVARMVVQLVGGKTDMSFYLFWLVVTAAAFIGKVLFVNLSTSISHTATFVTLRGIRKKLVSKLSRMPMGTLLDTPSGQVKDTIVDRVESLETPLAHLLPEMTANILVPILLLSYLFALDWRMALLSLVTLPVGMIFVSIMMKTYPTRYAGSVKVSKRMNNAVVEYVNGIEVIKAFNQSTNSYEKYTDAVNENAAYFYNWMKSCQLPMAAYNAICPAVLITVLPIGILLVMNGSIAVSTFITIIILSLGIMDPIIAATNFTDCLAQVGTIVGQITDILDAPELVRPIQEVKLKDTAIELKNVSFSYHKESGEFAVRNISLSIKPGTVTALVGPSGSGKSSVTKLIAGFWDVTEGEISIGGINLQKIPQHQLAEQIAYVAQDNYLFDDTIRENIRMGCRTATNEQVEQVAKDAGCHDFICKLENGYDTRVGGAGGHLSGGERQRITIARAMLKNAPIVILDEATAYIDPENEAVIQKAVAKLVRGKTLIVIAHRLSTITDSDQIVVMKVGSIVAKGSHEELLYTSPLYVDMWKAHIGLKESEKE